ncbi:MAG: cysteine peptidase family C39 domain-containing protein [Tannerellaceae bacterium]|nr:cysteine peptidase family C39 domain-containing protein [Tannerellaceae bacterium]
MEGVVEPWLLTILTKTRNGVSKMAGLKNAAELLGFTARGVRMSIEQLKKNFYPVLLFITHPDGRKDYVVCYGFEFGQFIVGDPFEGIFNCTVDEITYCWESGIVLLIYPDGEMSDRKTGQFYR